MESTSKLPFSTINKWYSDNIFGVDTPFGLIRAFKEYNYSVDMHMHDFFEVCVITSGSCTHYLGNECTPAVAGDILFIPPGVFHGISGDGKLNVINFLLHPQFFNRYMDDLFSLRAYPMLFLSGKNKPAKITPETSDMCALLGVLEQISRPVDDFSVNGAYTNALGLQAVALICTACGRNMAGNDERTYVAILEVIHYMSNNLDDKITIPSLAKRCYMSQSTLRREFLAMTGSTVIAYLHGLRLQKARQLLICTDAPISEIAQNCGFFDSAHFCRTFERTNGITPLAFRRRFSGKT